MILKIDQALIFYLLRHKELPLQGIGIFKLEGTIAEPADPDKPFVIPADAISFTYNPRIAEDNNLVQFISETTGKIIPLASADLDSYLTLSRQFLNIGKPMIIPNIGTIEKTNSGELIFKGGQYVMERMVPQKVSTEVEEAEPAPEESFSDFPSQKRNAGKGFLYLMILIILGFIVWAVWKYTFTPETENIITHTDVNPIADSSATTTSDTTVNKADSTSSLSVVSKPVLSDTSGFQVVVGYYRSLESGEKRLADMKLANRNVILYKVDSTHYRVAELFPKFALSDTNRIKDSMKLFYGPRNFLIEPIRK